MRRIEITIKGPSIHVVVRWDGHQQLLTRTANDYRTEFDTPEGRHSYVISAWGPEGETWTARVHQMEPPAGRDHSGVMGPHGQDTTGHQVFNV